jgi:hypothetical protein
VKSTAGLITPHPDRPLSEPCNKPPTRHTQGAGGNSISSSIASQGGWRGSPVPSNQSRGKFRVLEVAGCSWETSDCVLHLGGRCGETHGPDGHMVARYVVVRVVEECPRSSCAVQKRTMPTCERSISARRTPIVAEGAGARRWHVRHTLRWRGRRTLNRHWSQLNSQKLPRGSLHGAAQHRSRLASA